MYIFLSSSSTCLPRPCSHTCHMPCTYMHICSYKAIVLFIYLENKKIASSAVATKTAYFNPSPFHTETTLSKNNNSFLPFFIFMIMAKICIQNNSFSWRTKKQSSSKKSFCTKSHISIPQFHLTFQSHYQFYFCGDFLYIFLCWWFW